MASAPVPVNAQLRSDLHAENRAIYLPAISKPFAVFVRDKALPGSMPFVASDLNFLDPASRMFHYPYALYSAGQHNTANAPEPDMVSQRDRTRTIVLGDSGGFQVSTIPGFFKQRMVIDNLRWMEQVADHSMVLDFPTGGIDLGNTQEHIDRLTGEGHDLQAINASNRLGLAYNACLLQTQLNNDQFLKSRVPGATNFLNVLQGRSEKESKCWYEAVKHYPFEGWAFAGHHQNRFSLMLARLIDMRDDGLLEKADWVHVLGVSVLPIGVLLTVVQRTIRKLYNPAIQFSFDTASAFRSGGAYQRMLSGATFDKHGWTIQYMAPSSIGRSEEHRNLGDLLEESLASEVRRRRVSRTAVSRVLTLGDLRDPATGDLTEAGRNLLTHHNVEALIDAHDAAHDIWFDDPVVRDPLLSPRSVHFLAAFIETILEMPTDEAKAEIKKAAREYLDVLRPDV